MGSKQDYEAEYGQKPLGEFVSEIVGLDMNAAKEAFSEYLNDVTLDSRQVYFVNRIVEYIVRNGVMKDLSVLQESPFTHRGSIVEVFTDLSVWLGIRIIIERVNFNAVTARYLEIMLWLKNTYFNAETLFDIITKHGILKARCKMSNFAARPIFMLQGLRNHTGYSKRMTNLGNNQPSPGENRCQICSLMKNTKTWQIKLRTILTPCAEKQSLFLQIKLFVVWDFLRIGMTL